MTVHPGVRVVTGVVAALIIACGDAPMVGSGNGASPRASTTPGAPAQTASVQPSASPSPAQNAYVDDRSGPEQLIRSYYDAISRRQHLRA